MNELQNKIMEMLEKADACVAFAEQDKIYCEVCKNKVCNNEIYMITKSNGKHYCGECFREYCVKEFGLTTPIMEEHKNAMNKLRLENKNNGYMCPNCGKNEDKFIKKVFATHIKSLINYRQYDEEYAVLICPNCGILFDPQVNYKKA